MISSGIFFVRLSAVPRPSCLVIGMRMPSMMQERQREAEEEVEKAKQKARPQPLS